MILLCSDLDRTLIPNGNQPESPAARPLFKRLSRSGLIQLAYVSGRDRQLVEEAIRDYYLPQPDFVIGDVGTTLYRLENGEWNLNRAWVEQIGADWIGYEHDDIVALLSTLEEESKLTLQPDTKQGRYKVSYFTEPQENARQLSDAISEILDEKGIRTNLIWSLDEAENKGLLDILPAGANKVSAIKFLVEFKKISKDQVIFAGDSGNDMDALTSGLPAILVGNAALDVRREAVETVKNRQIEKMLYLARGGKYSFNGNYAAGVLEGLAHFFPEIEDWIRDEISCFPSAD